MDESVGGVADLRLKLAVPADDWVPVVSLANEQLVTPTLWTSLRRKACLGDLPADLQTYLTEIYDRNAQRNGMIRRQIYEAVAVLNEWGIAPVVLKGGTHLFEPGLDRGARMMRDADLLVPQVELHHSIAALKSIGYFTVDATDDFRTHSCTLHRDGALVTIDLHQDLGPQRKLLTNNRAWQAAEQIKLDAIRTAILCPTHRILYTILNFAVTEPRYRMALISLRQLHDLAIVVRQHADRIDWQAIRHAMARADLEHVLDNSTCLANRLLDVPLPSGVRRPAHARRYTRRYLLQTQSRTLMAAGRLWGRFTHPFSKVRMEYLYGCGRDPVRLALTRLRHARILYRRHYGRIMRTIAQDLSAH